MMGHTAPASQAAALRRAASELGVTPEALTRWTALVNRRVDAIRVDWLADILGEPTEALAGVLYETGWDPGRT
jgi:hypothetical protein